MITLYDSAFSPFARKVRLVLDWNVRRMALAVDEIAAIGGQRSVLDPPHSS